MARRRYRQGVAGKDDGQHSQAQHRAAQVVEYLPAPDGVHLVLDFLAALVTYRIAQPANDLPVAARPAVVPLGVVDIVARVVVEQLQVVDQAAAYVAAFYKVVAQNQVFGEGAFQHFLEHAQVVDAFATETSFVEDVLVQLETGRCVHVQTAKAGKELGVAALVGHLDVHIDARLHNAIAAVHSLAVGAQLGAVQRMGHCANQFLRRIKHQLGVGVEGDNKLYFRNRQLLPLAYGLAAETFLLVALAGLAQQQVVEMQYRAALALISQPGLLAVAPGTAAIDEIEYRRTVFFVQLLDFLLSGFCDFVVPRRVGLAIRGGIANQGVEKVLRTAFQTLALAGAVYVAQVVHLHLLQQLDGLLLVFQYGRHNDHRGVLFGYQAVFELDFEGVLRLVYLVEQLVEKVDDYLAHRHPHQQGDKCGDPTEMAGSQPTESECQRQRRQHHYPHIPPRAGLPPLRRKQQPTNVLPIGVGLLHQILDKLVFRFGFRLRFRQPNYLRPVVLFRLVVHLVVHRGLLFLQHLLRKADTVNQFCHRQFGHLLQRIEDVHHH